MKKRTKLLSLLLVVLMLVSAVTPFAVFAADTETTTSGTVSHLTTLEAISSTGKLIPNGLVLYNTFNTWTNVSATQASSSTVDSYTNTNLTITNSVGNLGGGKNGTAVLDGIDNKAIKISGLNTDPFYYIRVAEANKTEIAADSEIASYIGQSFVYQFDYKQSADGNVPFIAQMCTKFTTGSPGTSLLSVNGGYLRVIEVDEKTDKLVENYLMDANENKISVVGDDYTTIAVLVNPQLNRFWVIVNGKVIGDEGYTFMRKAEMKKLKDPVAGATYLYDEENPVPDRYLAYDIRCGVGANIDTYYENTMFYYVDQTYTCEDYLDILKPAGKKDVTDFTTIENVLATGKVVENGLILYNTFETWANTTDQNKPSATDPDLYGNTGVGTWTKPVSATGDNGSAALVKTDGNTALEVKSNNANPYYLLRINNAAKKAVADDSTISSFIGQSFVYQMDYKPSTLDFGANVNLITFHTKAVSGSNSNDKSITTVRLTKDGYIQVTNNGSGSFVDLKDTNGERVRLTANEFTTITLFVNPQINKYWVFINGEVTNEAGYTFLSKNDMKTLVVTASVSNGAATTEEDTYLYNESTGKFLDKDGNDTDNPVPYGYMLYDVRCTLGCITAYLDNIQFYFVDQTYTCEDYLGMFDIVKGNTATLGSTIGYNYYLNLPAKFREDNPDLMAKITVNGTTRRIKLADAAVTDKDIDGDGNVDNWVKITCGLSAAEMARDITLTIAQGSTVFYRETASVKEYAESITVANGYTKAAENAAKSMLVYGAYAQKFFDIDEDKLATDVTGAELKDIPTDKKYGIEGTRFNYDASAVALQSEVIICHYFDKVDGLTFTLNGKQLNAVADGDRFRVDITGIKAVDLDTVYALVVSDGTNSYTINYSAVGYAQQVVASSGNADLINLVKAMYTYNVYADAYAGA